MNKKEMTDAGIILSTTWLAANNSIGISLCYRHNAF